MSSYAKTIIQETLNRQPWIAPDYSATASAIERALLDAGFDLGHGHNRGRCREPEGVVMADQEITVADALAYAATRRVFKDTNSRVLVVLADALVAVEDERDALVARVARADALSDVKEEEK